jgi:hypothetical protein
MVLDCIVSSTLKKFSYLSPFVALAPMHQKEDPFFLSAPADFLYFRVKVIVPSLSALFPNSSWKILSYQSPLLRAVLLNQVKNHSVLLLSPRSLN